jgi:hypothetical protein
MDQSRITEGKAEDHPLRPAGPLDDCDLQLKEADEFLASIKVSSNAAAIPDCAADRQKQHQENYRKDKDELKKVLVRAVFTCVGKCYRSLGAQTDRK